MEQTMLKKEDFIRFILENPKSLQKKEQKKGTSALPEGFEGFGFDTETTPDIFKDARVTFAQRLLVASDFGYPEFVQTKNLIRSDDAVAKYLPDRASYWPKTPSRPYQTLLFEANMTHKALLSIPAFKSRKISHLDIVEDALARMVTEALEGFQRGGEGVTADVRKGRKEETLCIISIMDERDQEPVRLVCFGTQNGKTGGLETFHLTEQTRFWDQQLARDYLGLLYERQFKKLAGSAWQEAFTTTEERKQAEKLLDVCSKKTPTEKDIQEHVLNLLDTIAKGFGLRCKPGQPRRLQAFALPPDHDIGIDPEEMKTKHGGRNPFGGITLRDETYRLLGYIIYPLKAKKDAEKLRKYLGKNNRFHNVLVVFPDGNETTLELWQGREPLAGKLRKGKGFEGAAEVVNLLSRFFVVSKAKVRNPEELAQELAFRARYLRRLALKQLEEEPEKGPLRNLYNAFKEALVHDQTEEEFSDAFAQTITYGLLTARWIGNGQLVADGERFTRQTALKHLPAASPFLNDLFKSALSLKLDEQRGRLLWLVDDIADLLDRINVSYVFGVGDKDSDIATDPVIHFYEPFLAAYDKELKNKRGVFFTPRPVVSYIVRSVHELLQKEFGLEDGLASRDTWGDVATRISGLKIPEGVKASDPFVCILDPATGTGTFLFECIEVIERTMKDRWCRELNKENWKDLAVVTQWADYVPRYLLPRLYGYELMMASYAIADLKLSFKLMETGYRIGSGDHIQLYLTNTLEPPSTYANPKLASLFETLAKQAQGVNRVKRDKRFTIVVGNPPYSNYGQMNSNTWILGLLNRYKQNLHEKKLNLDDDYIKFLRFAQFVIEATGAGIIGFITNHTYLDGVTHRRLRECFLDSFGPLFFLDLHGSLKKAEQCPNGTPDKNVFDIQQGVAITLLARSGTNDGGSKGRVALHADLWGTRESKYASLLRESISSMSWTTLRPIAERFYFSPKNVENQDEYQAFISLRDIFHEAATGFETARDHFAIAFTADELHIRLAALLSSASDASVRNEWGLDDKRDWTLVGARARLRAMAKPYADIKRCCYRPLDFRFTHYNDIIVTWPRVKVLGNISAANPAIVASRMVKGEDPHHIFVVQEPTEKIFISGKTSNNAFVFPLYVRETAQSLFSDDGKRASDGLALNMRVDTLNTLLAAIDGEYAGDKPDTKALAAFRYTYAVLSSPCYRNRYQEFLKIDFPRVPRPTSEKLYRALSALGQRLIATHVLDTATLRKTGSKYIGEASQTVEKITYEKDAVWIDKNKTCGFKGVPEEVWAHYVGGYQVCEKWLKYRKGRTLFKDDIEHYQKIVVAISETIRIMKEIDEVIEKYGGWPGAFQSGKKDGE